jgi:organic radical activating enzyme
LIENLELKRIFIYGFGIAGKWLATNLTANIAGYIDSDLKKNGGTFNGLPVFSPEQAKGLIKPDDEIVISVIDIQDVVPNIKKHFPKTKWIALGQYLSDQKAVNNTTNESNSFIEYTLKAVETCHKNYLEENTSFLRSLDIVITEKCSLNCQDCSNLMQYYEDPRNLDYDEVIKDFETLTKTVKHIYEVRLIGGEPFMNRDIYQIIDYFVISDKVSKVILYTNATIPLKKELMKKFATPKLVFSITDYGALSKNTNKVISILEEMQVAYRSLPPNNWTDSAKIADFQRSDENMRNIFEQCCGKNLYTTMYGKLYRCPFSANAERLGAIPLDSSNSVSVDADEETINQFIGDIPYIPACNFCNGRSHDAPEIVPAIQSSDRLPYKKYISLKAI